MAKNIDDSKLDLRALKLNISRGNVTKKEYEDFVKALPDLSKEMEEIPAFHEEEEETTLLESKEDESTEDLTFSVV